MWNLELNNILLCLIFKSIKIYCSILHLEWIFMCAIVRSKGNSVSPNSKRQKIQKSVIPISISKCMLGITSAFQSPC